MSVPSKCRDCGFAFTSQMLSLNNVSGVTISGCTESCPRCGGRSDLQPGTYDFVGNAISAFRAPGTTQKKVEEFAGIVSQAAAGEISPEDAVKQARQVSASFGSLLKAAHDRGITFDRILALVLAIHAFWTTHSSDADVQAAQ